MTRDAAALRVGLRLGLLKVEDVVTWVDGQIATLDDPPATLLDLSLMGDSSPADVHGRLQDISADVPSLEILPAVLARGIDQLRADPGLGPIVARGLYELYVEANYEVPPDLREIGRLDDAYSLAEAEQGTYGTTEEAFRDLLAFAAQFERAR